MGSQTSIDWLGLHTAPESLTFFQMAGRAVIVFFVTLVAARLGSRRFMAKMAAFDVILGFILASVLSRAVNGSAAFLPTLGAGVVLIVLHRLMGHLGYWSQTIGWLVKGDPVVLAARGRLRVDAMAAHAISADDLLEEARLNALIDDIRQIRLATLERNGQVSVLPEAQGR